MNQMNPQTIARVTGVLFLITFITAIGALICFQPLLDDPRGYVAGAGDDNRILLGALLELLLIVANVGTAVVLYPVLRRQNEVFAIGYVGARLVECTFIAIGLFAVLAAVKWQDAAGVSPELAENLALVKDWTFLLGPGFIVGLGNGLLLGYLMYKSGLVPPGLAVLGLIGGPLICLSGIAVLFDAFQFGGTGQSIATIPEFLWELSLGIYLTVWGFRRDAPILSAGARDSAG